MTQIELKIPELGNEITEAQVDLWHKDIGEPVSKGEDIVTITTPKVSMELEAPANGTLTKIIVEEDEIATVGSVLAIIDA